VYFYRFGNCVPYEADEESLSCDALYTPGVDYVYIPYQRAGGNIDEYLYNLELAGLFISGVPLHQCFESAKEVLCHYLLPPCGNATVFEPPTSVCMEVCNYLRKLCPMEWELVVAFFEENDADLRPQACK